MLKKLSQEEANKKVLNKCEEKNYTLVESFIYKNNITKIHLRCNEHNQDWFAVYRNFVKGKSNCELCKTRYNSLSQEESTKNVLNKCEKKNYTLIEPFVYKNNKTKIHLRCNIDNYKWFVNYNSFINKNLGCAKCAKNNKYTEKEMKTIILNRCSHMNYTLIEPFVYKNCHTRIQLECNQHKYLWKTSCNKFIHAKTGCPKCNKSKGEILISEILTDNNIVFYEEYKFDECKYKHKLPFDFYLSEYNICIEYDGEQHYKSKKYYGGDEKFKLQQLKDNIKTEYCKNVNIKLIRIKYNENVMNRLEREIFNKIMILEK